MYVLGNKLGVLNELRKDLFPLLILTGAICHSDAEADGEEAASCLEDWPRSSLATVLVFLGGFAASSPSFQPPFMFGTGLKEAMGDGGLDDGEGRAREGCRGTPGSVAGAAVGVNSPILTPFWITGACCGTRCVGEHPCGFSDAETQG